MALMRALLFFAPNPGDAVDALDGPFVMNEMTGLSLHGNPISMSRRAFTLFLDSEMHLDSGWSLYKSWSLHRRKSSLSFFSFLSSILTIL